jgi:putative addiction module component (TIGR02574 family)
MSEQSASLLTAALELPEAERAELVTRLLDSLDLSVDDAGPMTDAEFVAELDRRAAEMRSDAEAGIPWE